MEFTHFNKDGKAKMVNVSTKEKTYRSAKARGYVQVNPQTLQLIQSGGIKKGDVLSVSQVAGIMASKKTSDLIPMCHPIMINGCDIYFRILEEKSMIEITSELKCYERTGIEMEALTAVSIAALTIYDMCKAIQRDIRICDIHLIEKTGGKEDFRSDDDEI